MFTGIIEELGRVSAIEKQPDAIRLTISCGKVLSDLKRGDSISCSGTCLTAMEIDGSSFTADVMLETLKRSSLSEVKVGDVINLRLDPKDPRRVLARIRLSADTVAAAQRNITEAVVRLARVSTSTSPAQFSSRYSRVDTARA